SAIGVKEAQTVGLVNYRHELSQKLHLHTVESVRDFRAIRCHTSDELLHRLVYPSYFEVGLTTSDITHIECDTEVAEVFCSRTCSDLRYDCVVIKQRYVDRSNCLTEELVALYVDTCLLLEVASRNRTVVVTEGRLKIRV